MSSRMAQQLSSPTAAAVGRTSPIPLRCPHPVRQVGLHRPAAAAHKPTGKQPPGATQGSHARRMVASEGLDGSITLSESSTFSDVPSAQPWGQHDLADLRETSESASSPNHPQGAFAMHGRANKLLYRNVEIF